jgi:hypothetical protein
MSYMSSPKPYKVVSEKADSDAYRHLTVAYLDWVLEPECDATYNKIVQVGNERRYVTFMRDDSIGDPKNPDEDDNLPFIREINRPEGTDIFFPVYYFHSSIGEGNGQGGKCKDIKDCVSAAEYDLKKIKSDDNGNKMIWAKISINGKQAENITPNFDDHYVVNSGFKITVDENRFNREPEFHLKAGKTYEGAVLGTFMYLRNFRKGDYVLDFGGVASNFITRSLYKMHVT